MGAEPPLRPPLPLRGRRRVEPRGLLRGARIALLALHGFTGSGPDWDPLRARLGRLVAPDLPGHGPEPETDPGRCRMADAANCAVAALDAAGIARAVVLGYSMGGRAALHLAVTQPERVQALVLIGATPGLRSEGERAARRAADEGLAARLRSGGLDAFLAHWEQLPIIATQRRIPAPARAAMRARRLASSAEGWAASLRGMGTGAMEPLWDRLPSIRVPTLWLTGEDDPKFGAIADEASARMPDARHARVPGAGHCAHLEATEAATAAILRFLRPR